MCGRWKSDPPLFQHSTTNHAFQRENRLVLKIPNTFVFVNSFVLSKQNCTRLWTVSPSRTTASLARDIIHSCRARRRPCGVAKDANERNSGDIPSAGSALVHTRVLRDCLT